MRMDWGKILLFLLALIVAQRVIAYVLVLIGLEGFALVFVFDFIVSFLFTYLYYPSFARRHALKDPNFYKNWGIFLLILLALDLLL